ncbi:hypothetical protein ACQPZK_13730 [Micromonospora sp. CA-249363]|uniref:hypothetical protein n=1 Tax=Micromonospora sp. CA-249363 TaxID=3239963 RepID=UPI003D935CE8
MLIIAEERDNYPPDGQIPNLETDDKANDEILTRIKDLLPDNLKLEVIGALMNWSASKLLPHRTFATWNEAVDVAIRFARNDKALSAAGSLPKREEAVGSDEKLELSKALASTGRIDDPQIVLRDESRRWANCGMAAFQIREQLHDKGGEPVRLSGETYGAGKGDALKKALLVKPASADTVLLLDCQFPQVHNFVVEVHHDGSRYLAQGYQGTYFAHWWLGINKSYSGTPSAEILALRERYGLGHPISPENYESLLDGLAVAISGDWQATADQWRTLPFNPDRQEVDGIRRRSESPTLLVEVFELRKPAVARAALGGDSVASLSELATRGLKTA